MARERRRLRAHTSVQHAHTYVYSTIWFMSAHCRIPECPPPPLGGGVETIESSGKRFSKCLKVASQGVGRCLQLRKRVLIGWQYLCQRSPSHGGPGARGGVLQQQQLQAVCSFKLATRGSDKLRGVFAKLQSYTWIYMLLQWIPARSSRKNHVLQQQLQKAR